MRLNPLILAALLPLVSPAETLQEFVAKNGSKANPPELAPHYLRIYPAEFNKIRAILIYSVQNPNSNVEPAPSTMLVINSARKDSLEQIVARDENSNKNFDDEDSIEYIGENPKIYHGKDAPKEIKDRFYEIYDLVEEAFGIKEYEKNKASKSITRSPVLS